jgi:D-beta-D-heptose 7-phosphate kinase/D-beta-D-heptose 1-phosphate adenosyltransferase
MKIVIATGGFDPLHRGHIEYISAAKSLGDYLIVAVNSDAWLTRKKNKPFMSIQDRVSIVENLKMVDEAWALDDEFDADNSCIKVIENILHNYPNDQVVFANGGDRTKTNIPEMSINNPRLSFEFGVGGDNKQNSSSWLLEKWQSTNPAKFRTWGWWTVLKDYSPAVKVKELVVDPGKTLSMQRHFKRNEIWFVASGEASVYGEGTECELKQFETIEIIKEEWHQLHNTSKNEPLHIIEIQWGDDCSEDDIERREC